MATVEEIDDIQPPAIIDSKEVSYHVVRDQVYKAMSDQILSVTGFTSDSDVYKYAEDGSIEKAPFIKNRNRFLTNDSFKDAYQMSKWMREQGKLPDYMEIKPSVVCGTVRNPKRKDKKEYAVYVKKSIKQGTTLGMLQGQLRPYIKNIFTAGYCFPAGSLTSKEQYLIDCENFTFANWSRFINHSENPALEFHPYNMQSLIVAKRDIEEGEELTVDYGKGYWKEFETVSKPEDRSDNVAR